MAEGKADERKIPWFYAKMSEDEFVAYIRHLMDEKGINGRGELENADVGLYNALRRREKGSSGIREMVGFCDKRRNWDSMDDDELVAHARRFMEEKGIRGRRELAKTDSGLYHGLLRRKKVNPGIMGRVGFGHKQRDWKAMSDDELVAHAKRFMEEKGLDKRKELEKADGTLYQALLKRKKKSPRIMDKVFSAIDSSKQKEAVDGVLDALKSFGDDG